MTATSDISGPATDSERMQEPVDGVTTKSTTERSADVLLLGPPAGLRRPPVVCACGEVAWVVLTMGRVSIIDPGDVPAVGRWSWRAIPKKHGTYAASKVSGRMTLLARFIMGASGDDLVDHRNGDTLDNRRANLRLATWTENARNRRKRRSAATPYKGIHFAPKYARRPWRATMKIDGRNRDLGCYQTPEEAARAWDQAARIHHGEFARLNFPNDTPQR